MHDHSQAAGSNRQWHCSKGLCIFCANHYQASTTVDKSQLAIFFSLETYFITIKIWTVFFYVASWLVRYPSLYSGEVDIFHYAFSMFLINSKFCYTATEIWNEKENGLLYRMPEWASRNIQFDLLHVTGYRAKNLQSNGSVFIERLLQRYI